MQSYVILSTGLLMLIVSFELLKINRIGIDPFTIISGAFLLLFVVAPSIVYLTPSDAPILAKLYWMASPPTDGTLYLYAFMIVALAYVSCLLGFYLKSLVGSLAPAGGLHDEARGNTTMYLYLGFGLLCFGLATFISFLYIVGGPVEAFSRAWYLRAGTPDTGPMTHLAFIKHFAFFVVPASVFLLQAASGQSEVNRRSVALWSLATLGCMASLIVLTFMQGRLGLGIYIVTLILPMWIGPNSLRVDVNLMKIGAICAIVGAVALVGTVTKPMSAIVIATLPSDANVGRLHPEAQTTVTIPGQNNANLGRGEKTRQAKSREQVSGSTTNIENTAKSATTIRAPNAVTSIGLEFAFPFFNILSAIEHVPRDINYRWFSDLVLPFLNLVPKRIIPLRDYLPLRPYEQNTIFQVGKVEWGIPVDLITFGWFSLGTTGVIIWAFAFGYAVRSLDGIMPRSTYGDGVLRWSVLALAGALVMYGDLNWFVTEMFHWWVAWVLYFIFVLKGQSLFPGAVFVEHK